MINRRVRTRSVGLKTQNQKSRYFVHISESAKGSCEDRNTWYSKTKNIDSIFEELFIVTYVSIKDWIS